MKNPNYKIKLDDIGSWVWQNIDGKSSVAKIEDGLEQAFGKRVEPVSERLQLFIQSLINNGFIVLMQKNK